MSIKDEIIQHDKRICVLEKNYQSLSKRVDTILRISLPQIEIVLSSLRVQIAIMTVANVLSIVISLYLSYTVK